MENKDKIILDLCGGTGSWSLPYQEAGYNVWNVTLPNWDITRWFTGREFDIKPPEVYGILAAPPCTMFSDARTNAKTPRDLKGGMKIVQACLDIIHSYQFGIKSDQQKHSPLKFWALENPYYGKLKWFLGEPYFTFNPYDFGHNYQKKTAVWGLFNRQGLYDRMTVTKLSKKEKELAKTNSQKLPKFDYMKSKTIAPEWFGKLSRQDRRAITPRGFALAFYEANN